MVENYQQRTKLQRYLRTQPASVQMMLRSTYWCGTSPLNKNGEVTLSTTNYEGGERHAHFGGLKLCHSPWCCPVCSARYLSYSVLRVTSIINNMARLRGFVARMLTLTIPHNRFDSAATVIDELKRSRSIFARNLGARLLAHGVNHGGTITSTECKHSLNSGWHFHFHILIFVDEAGSNWLDDHVSYLDRLWRNAVSKVTGKDLNVTKQGVTPFYLSKQVVTDGHYIAKELVKETNGSSKSCSPFQLLASEDPRDIAAFIEFAAATRNRSRIFCSQGLAQMVDEDEISKNFDGARGVATSTTVVCSWTPEDWSEIVQLDVDCGIWNDTAGSVVQLLATAAETGDVYSIIRVCDDFGLPYPRLINKTYIGDINILECYSDFSTGNYTDKTVNAPPADSDTVAGAPTTILPAPYQMATCGSLSTVVVPDEIYDEETFAEMRKYHCRTRDDLREIHQILEGLF